MENLIKIDTVDQYNKMFGLETLHPFGECGRFIQVRDMVY